ncbi:hypothetical protein BO99DRAFT_385913 [Aspergillus violaceofuscus CBS 115571]|uniref:HNH domain-containing protein n=1 Tax=Aspergillus violaceofuscus (strain CBS 115571) TaxID=1450538 RepID=A0A2V5HAC1_ASPV1|nr:hypothetical protein BO99DRAFT_385913 [Aspergillus violaceofuscus CBS 115571]
MTNTENYQVFRECLSTAIVEKFSTPAQPKKARRTRGAVSQRQKTRKDPSGTSAAADASQSLPDRASPEELAEFIDFLATETFPALPPSIQTLTYTPPPPPTTTTTTTTPSTRNPPTTTPSTPTTTRNTTEASAPETDPRALAETLCSTTLPASVHDTLTTYALLADTPVQDGADADALATFFTPILTEYIGAVTRPPPVWATTRTDSCEICGRDWIPLSYHHLIPRSVHAKTLKKGWHPEWMLNSVAWLCRACHSFVHRMAGNEELAREWFTVDRICEREDVRVWAAWVGRVRWKAR